MKPTNICKNCFQNNSPKSFHELFSIDNYVCANCLFKLHPYFKKFSIDGIEGLALYPYKESAREMIFRFKGCYDYEMKFVFLSMFKKELSCLFKDYILIPSPSHINGNKKRGFNHVVEMFSILKLPILDILEKTEDITQHTLNFHERIKVSSIIQLKKTVDLTDKKVLLVDDIVTTGSTLRRSIELVKKLNPKKIKILVVAKTEFSKEEKAKLDKNYPILD